MLHLVNWKHLYQPECMQRSSFCSVEYVVFSDCTLGLCTIAVCTTAQITAHCTVQIADCRACLEYCICRLHLRLLVGCYALAISVQCSLLLTVQITLCSFMCMCKIIFSSADHNYFPQSVILSAHEMFSETTLDGWGLHRLLPSTST